MCRCCRLCWEDLYWNCIEERFCFDESIANYDPDEDEHYLKRHTGNGYVPDLETATTREKKEQAGADAIISIQPARRSNQSNPEGVREVQPFANVLAPEILAAFANSQIFSESHHPSPRVQSPLPGVHGSHSASAAAAETHSEELMKRLEGSRARSRATSESPVTLRTSKIPKIIAEEQDSKAKSSSPDFSTLKIVNKNLQLEAPYFSFRPASENDIFMISSSSNSGRISTTPEVPSVSFSQLPKNYAETPSIGQYRESKSLYEIQTAGIKEDDYSMPRYYTKSHLMPKPRPAESGAIEHTPKRVEKSKRLKNIRMQLPPLMIHSSNSSIDRAKEGLPDLVSSMARKHSEPGTEQERQKLLPKLKLIKIF